MGKLTIILAFLLASRALSSLCDDPNYEPPPKNPPRLCLESWEYNRTFSASTNMPIARALNPSAPFRHALGNLTAHFTSEYERMRELLQKKTPLFVENNMHACGLKPDFSEIIKVNRSISTYGWGVMGEECTTALSTTDLSDSIVDSMYTYISVLKNIAPAAVRAAGLRFAKPTTLNEFFYKTDTDSCSLHHFVAFRVAGLWRVTTGITNQPLNIFTPDRRRHYLLEILHLSGGRVAPTLLTLPRRPRWDPRRSPENQTVPRDWVPRTSTALAMWGGSPASSAFREIMAPASNPAVQSAIAQGADTRVQVQDATTPSNIAILLVPLALTIIPVSLFADVGTAALVAYALVTDVLSALPLAIKGEELRLFGKKQSRATTTWVYGGREEGDLAAAETWHADCKGEEWFVRLGIGFILLAMVMMVVGVGLEIYCRDGMEGRKLRSKLLERKRKVDAKLQLWERCVECECQTVGVPTFLPWQSTGQSRSRASSTYFIDLLHRLSPSTSASFAVGR